MIQLHIETQNRKGLFPYRGVEVNFHKNHAGLPENVWTVEMGNVDHQSIIILGYYYSETRALAVVQEIKMCLLSPEILYGNGSIGTHDRGDNYIFDFNITINQSVYSMPEANT